MGIFIVCPLFILVSKLTEVKLVLLLCLFYLHRKGPIRLRGKGRGRSSSRRRLLGGDWEDCVLEARGRGRKDAGRRWQKLVDALYTVDWLFMEALLSTEDKLHDGNTKTRALADRDSSIGSILQANASLNYRRV